MQSHFIDYPSAPELPICFQVFFLFFCLWREVFFGRFSKYEIRVKYGNWDGKGRFRSICIQKLANSMQHAEAQIEQTAKVELTSTLRNGHLQVENSVNR